MKFFIPVSKTADPERVYNAIRTFNAEQLPATLSPRRIYSVKGVHNGEPFTARVGDPFESPPEDVLAILLDTTRNCYLICTANRGVLGGMPYLSGSDEISHVEYFED